MRTSSPPLALEFGRSETETPTSTIDASGFPERSIAQWVSLRRGGEV
jgi:hypothetical protein